MTWICTRLDEAGRFMGYMGDLRMLVLECRSGRQR